MALREMSEAERKVRVKYPFAYRKGEHKGRNVWATAQDYYDFVEVKNPNITFPHEAVGYLGSDWEDAAKNL